MLACVVPTERELLEAWAGGDGEAARELYERYFDGISRFFLSKAEQDAEDLIQRTFEACIKSRHRLAEVSSFKAYLFTIARHELFAWVRRRRANEPFDSMAVSMVDLGTSPSLAVARAENEQRLLSALRRLPIELQIALELYYWEQLGTQELAEVLAIPRGTVKSRLFRAREALREELAQIDDSPAAVEQTMTRLADWARGLRDAASTP